MKTRVTHNCKVIEMRTRSNNATPISFNQNAQVQHRRRRKGAFEAAIFIAPFFFLITSFIQARYKFHANSFKVLNATVFEIKLE